MKLSKQFTQREKILMVILAALCIFAVYYFVVDIPVQRSLDEIRAASDQAQLDIQLMEAQKLKMDRMRRELDEVLALPNAAEIPKYDNLQAVIRFLNGLVSGTAKYSIDFQGLNNPEDGNIVRRSVNMRFDSPSYADALERIQRLQSCPFRCLISSLDVTPFSKDKDRGDRILSLTSDQVSVSLTVTFFESK